MARPSPSATAPPAPAEVDIVEPSGQSPQAWAFQPAGLTVRLGTAIRWVNKGVAGHTVTADDGKFDSGELDAKQAFTFTPTAPGTYTYACSFHPWMKGTITVTR